MNPKLKIETQVKELTYECASVFVEKTNDDELRYVILFDKEPSISLLRNLTCWLSEEGYRRWRFAVALPNYIYST